MAATIIQPWQKRADQLTKQETERWEQHVFAFDGPLPDDVRSESIAAARRRTRRTEKWTFVMLAPEQNAAVVRHIVDHSKRPMVACKLWAMCFEHMNQETGQINLSRDAFAEQLGIRADHVSEIMSELVEFGAIITKRTKVVGLRGPGRVEYFMNPRVATCLPEGQREKSQSEAPYLPGFEPRVIPGGKGVGP